MCHINFEFTDTDFNADEITLTTDFGVTTEGTTHYSADIDSANQPFVASENIFTFAHTAPPFASTDGGAQNNQFDPEWVV